MNISNFLLSNFNGKHARSGFQRVLQYGRQLCTVNTMLVVAASCFSLLQLREPNQTSTSFQNNDGSSSKIQLTNITNDYELKRDTTVHEGFLLMRQSDCYSCHADQKEMTAPSYVEIAEKYRKEKNVEARLVNKVIQGGKGEWGNDRAMTPHPELLRDDAQKMIEYILQLRRIKVPPSAPAKSQ